MVGMARALLKQRGMPAKFWGEAVVTADHQLNRSPTKSLQGMTPYEAWYGRAPAVAHLRVFGCLCFVKELNQVRKLDDRSRPGVFLGYADGAKAYCNEYGTIYAISSDFGDRMTTQHLD